MAVTIKVTSKKIKWTVWAFTNGIKDMSIKVTSKMERWKDKVNSEIKTEHHSMGYLNATSFKW